MKNPSYGELRSLCQINQVCKEENQRRNLTFNSFATLCELPKRSTNCRTESKTVNNEFRKPCEAKTKEFRKPSKTDEFHNPLRNFRNLMKSSYNLQIFLHRLR